MFGPEYISNKPKEHVKLGSDCFHNWVKYLIGLFVFSLGTSIIYNLTSHAWSIPRYTETGWPSQPACLWAAGIRTAPRNGRWTIRLSSPGSSTFSPRWALAPVYLIRIRILGSDLRTQNLQWHGFSSVLRIQDVYPGSEFFHPGSRIKKIPDPHQRI